jgi:hypothetical protein
MGVFKNMNEIKLGAECKLLLPVCLIGEQNTISNNCRSYIQEKIKYDYEWVDGFLESKFSHYRSLKASAQLCAKAGYTLMDIATLIDLRFLNDFNWCGIKVKVGNPI